MARSLRDVMPSVAALLTHRGADNTLGLRDVQGSARRVVVVLVDGLGYHLLRRIEQPSGVLADVLAGAVGSLDELACVFPSTTPVNLVSLTTGVAPGEHGVLGFTVAVPGTSSRLTHVRWQADPDPSRWQPVPTWFERLAGHGRASTVVLPREFLASGLTAATYRGARLRGVGGDDELVTAIGAALDDCDLVVGYTAVLDTAAHTHGIASPQWQAAAAQVDRLLTRLAETLPAGTLLLVTADHGGLDVDPATRLDLADRPELRDGVRLVAGEPRVRYVHVQDGARDDVLAAWRGVLGARALVLTRDEAVASGRFGPVPGAHLERIGDVVVVCRGAAAVFDSMGEPATLATLVGLHGAEEPVETAVPLIAIPC